jgi:pilus assembly protein CpaC
MRQPEQRNLERRVVLFAALALALALPAAWAEETAPQREKVKNMSFYTDVRRAAIDDPTVAIVTARSPREIAVIGKEPGATKLTLVFADGERRVYDVEVTAEGIQVIEAKGIDVSRLKQRINSLLPEEKEIRVIASEDSITLAGRVSSSASLSQVLALAESHAPKGKVINLVEVAGVHQVMLEVRVSEMSRSLTKRLGANLLYTKGGDFGILLPGRLADLPQGGGGNDGQFELGPALLSRLSGRERPVQVS